MQPKHVVLVDMMLCGLWAGDPSPKPKFLCDEAAGADGHDEAHARAYSGRDAASNDMAPRLTGAAGPDLTTCSRARASQ